MNITIEMGSVVHQSYLDLWFLFFSMSSQMFCSYLVKYGCSGQSWGNVAQRCKMTKHHKTFEYSRFCQGSSMEWFWTGKDILKIVMDPLFSCLRGSIFDGIIGYLKDPDTGRSRFESAMFTYVIVMVLQGCFSYWAAQITETSYVL